MARDNRKSGVSLMPTMSSALLVCMAVAVAALGRIRLKGDENRLYTEINRIESQVHEVRRLNRKLQVDYEILTSPAGLTTRIREMNLHLVMPGDGARVVLPEPLPDGTLPPELAWDAERSGGRVAAGQAQQVAVRRDP